MDKNFIMEIINSELPSLVESSDKARDEMWMYRGAVQYAEYLKGKAEEEIGKEVKDAHEEDAT